MKRLILVDFLFLLFEEMVFLGTNFQEIDKVHVDREIRYYLLNHVFKASVKFNNHNLLFFRFFRI